MDGNIKQIMLNSGYYFNNIIKYQAGDNFLRFTDGDEESFMVPWSSIAYIKFKESK